MRKYVNYTLAVALVVFLAVVFVGTTIKYGRNYAYGVLVTYKDDLHEGSTLYDNLRARIGMLEYNTNNRLLTRSYMRKLNARMQSALGKNLISIGSSKMTTLKCGALYDVFSEAYNTTKMDELIAFAADIREKKNIPTLLVYCHGGLYEDDQLDEGLSQIDNNPECADYLTSRFRAGGVPVTDSRDAYKAAGLTIDQAIMKSDVHWAHRMALETAKAAARDMNREFGTAFDFSALEYEKFAENVYPQIFLGGFGQRIGIERAPLDDIHMLYPTYDTHIFYEAENDDYVQREGTFMEAVIEPDKLKINPDEGASTSAYYIYGDYLAQTHTINENAAEGKVLIFKDSYGTPVTAFLALTCREVYAVDLRSTTLSMMDWVNNVQPDIVLFAYSQQMMRSFDYIIAN